jgi:hypothetical protein
VRSNTRDVGLVRVDHEWLNVDLPVPIQQVDPVEVQGADGGGEAP